MSRTDPKDALHLDHPQWSGYLTACQKRVRGRDFQTIEDPMAVTCDLCRLTAEWTQAYLDARPL